VVGTGDELFRADVTIGDLNWIADPPRPGDHVEVQLRHRAPATVAEVVRLDGELELRLEEPQRAVTPGQSGAVYLGDRLLGGGRIR
jgi:tRNA-uridine 2-sulfurtransferase